MIRIRSPRPFLPVALVASLTLLLAACGGGGSDSKAASSGTQAASSGTQAASSGTQASSSAAHAGGGSAAPATGTCQSLTTDEVKDAIGGTVSLANVCQFSADGSSTLGGSSQFTRQVNLSCSRVASVPEWKAGLTVGAFITGIGDTAYLVKGSGTSPTVEFAVGNNTCDLQVLGVQGDSKTKLEQAVRSLATVAALHQRQG